MKKSDWKKKITKACKDAGTYQPFFGSVIDTLAGLMETRDLAQKQFNESGGKTVITHVGTAGMEKRVKNPALQVVLDCNAQALSYWKELGLTAKTYKDMQKEAKIQKKSALEEALEAMMG